MTGEDTTELIFQLQDTIVTVITSLVAGFGVVCGLLIRWLIALSRKMTDMEKELIKKCNKEDHE